MPKITQLLSTGVIGSLGGAGAIWTTLENGGNPIAPWPICSALIGGLGALAAWRTLREPKLDPEQIDRIDSNTQKGQEAAAEAIRAARGEGAKVRETVRGEGHKTLDAVKALEEKIDVLVAEKQKEAEAKGTPLSAEQLTTFEDGIRAVLMSTDARKAPAQEMLAEQREIDAADYLMSAGLQGEAQLQDAMKDQASFFKEAGEIYQASMPAKALEAFRKATQLDGSDFNAWIYLARLEQSHAGDLAAARIAAKAGLSAASEEREKSIAHDELGSIAVAEGNLSDARDAYTKSMEIRQALSDADQNSASAKRDLSVSLDRLGDIAVAEGNLTDARDAYTKSMEIRQALSDADQNSASAKRDLSVSLERLGDIAVAEGNLTDARDAFTKSMEIRQTLSDADQNSASAKRDLSVSLNKLGDIAVAEGNLTDARDAFTKGMVIAQALADADPNSASAKRDVIAALDRLGGVTGDKAYFVRALAIAEEMAAAGQLSPADAFIPDYLRAKIEGE